VDRARHVLKRLLGEIKLRATPEGDALVAEIRVGAGALLRLVSNGTTENCVGSGGPLYAVSTDPITVCVKPGKS
jgi:hypothetical protein